MKKDLTQELLHELFDYCDERGALIWKKRGPGRPVDKPAGRKHYKNGYIDFSYNYVKYAAHRMIWIWHNGPIPNGLFIDHINGVTDDNRLSNLQLCTPSENIKKSVVRADNTSGVSGVHYNSRDRVWVVNIYIDRKITFVGLSKNKEDAIAMRLEAERKHYGSFAPSLYAHTGQPTGEFNDSND